MTQPDPDLVKQLINNRPRVDPQIAAHMPTNRGQAINLMPTETKLQIAQMVIDRMAKAYRLTAHTERDGNTLTITINP